MRRNSLQTRNQIVRGLRGASTFDSEMISRRSNIFAVETVVGIVVWTKCRALQRNTGEYAA